MHVFDYVLLCYLVLHVFVLLCYCCMLVFFCCMCSCCMLLVIVVILFWCVLMHCIMIALIVVLFHFFISGLVCYVLYCFIVLCYRGTVSLVLYYCVCDVVCIISAAAASVVSGCVFLLWYVCVLVLHVLQVLFYCVSCCSVLLL